MTPRANKIVKQSVIILIGLALQVHIVFYFWEGYQIIRLSKDIFPNDEISLYEKRYFRSETVCRISSLPVRLSDTEE